MTALPPQTLNVDVAIQEAFRLLQAKRLPEAENVCRRLLQDQPRHPDVNHVLAITLKDQGRTAEATAAFRRVADLAPNAPAAHNNLGTILFSQGALGEAETCYRRALALDPNMVDALKNLGLVLVDAGRSTESHAWFKRHAELAYGRPQSPLPGQPPVLPHKLQHDREQYEYLNAGKTAGHAAPFAFHLEAGARVPGRAVNPNQRSDVEARWLSSTPQHVVIDNLLTDEALEALRRYCWGSTIWHRAHKNGYVGAMPEHGFVCPLMAQIDEELRSTYPAVLGNYPLLRWWAFKYDSRLKGINLHADFAAVNVNFWITPDEANLDPDSGGLIVWDKAAPLDWTFAQFNGAGQSVRDFLDKAGARSVTVPHRSNRALIFDSDLFHETDRIAFKEGYLNRRINITMLYGRRGEAVAKPA
jgi:Tfp pilus assembly protein PilF